MKKQQGYILVLTLFIVAMAMVLVTAIVQNSLNFQRQARITVDREQARMLALSGLNLAQSQISLVIEAKKEGSKDSPELMWFKQLLPIVNTWQTINLKEDIVGVDSTIKLYITPEEGKINLKYLDMLVNKKDESAQATVRALDDLIKKEVDISISEILKKRRADLGRALEDPSELKLNKPLCMADEKELAVMDLFTTATTSGKFNPWFLTKSVRKVLQLTDRMKNNEELLKKFKTNLQWPKDWNDIFVPLYGKQFEALPKPIAALMATQFEVQACSVVCYAQVGKITQKVCALFEKERVPQGFAPQSVFFKLVKLYWL